MTALFRLVAQGGRAEQAAEERLQPFAQGGLDRTGEIDLAIEGSQKLDRLDAAVVVSEPAAVTNELVGQIFEGVAEFLETASSLRRNPSPNRPAMQG